jgi:hypothetical protein
VEQLAVADVVTVDELIVSEDVAVRVEDALGQAGGTRGVVELGRIVRRGVDAIELCRGAAQQLVVEDQDLVDQ